MLFSESISIIKNSDGKGGIYLQSDYDGFHYGQFYPAGTAVQEARSRFIKFYLPLYLKDAECESLAAFYACHPAD